MEAEKELILKKVQKILNEVSETNEDALTKEFLDLKVHCSPLAIEDAVAIILDRAIEKPELSALYAKMCAKQVIEELQDGRNVLRFRQALQLRKRDPFFSGATLREFMRTEKEKQAEIAAETDHLKQEEMQKALLEMQYEMNRRRFVDIKFIGHLFLLDIIPLRVIFDCTTKLLASVTDEPHKGNVYEADVQSIERAVWLFETVGSKLHEHNEQIDRDAAAAAAAGTRQTQLRMPFPLDMTFEVLEKASTLVERSLRKRIVRLIKLRENGWVQVEEANQEEIKMEVSPEQEKDREERSKLRWAVAEMQDAMEAMRTAMVELEERNKVLLELVRSMRE